MPEFFQKKTDPYWQLKYLKGELQKQINEFRGQKRVVRKLAAEDDFAGSEYQYRYCYVMRASWRFLYILVC